MDELEEVGEEEESKVEQRRVEDREEEAMAFISRGKKKARFEDGRRLRSRNGGRFAEREPRERLTGRIFHLKN